MSTVDFVGAIPGMTYLFSAPKNHRLTLPEVAILSEEEDAGTSVDHKNKPHPTDSIDVEGTSVLAKGMSQKQLMAYQKAVLSEAEKSKQVKAAQELEHIKQAVPDVSIGSQTAALQAFEKENNEAKVAKRSSLPPRGDDYTGEDNAHLRPGHPLRQHSYEAVGSPQRKHLGSRTKFASLAQGEQIYNQLDSRGYQQRPLHERPALPRPSPRNMSDQTPRNQVQEPPPWEHPLQQPPSGQQPPHQPLPQWSQQAPQQWSQSTLQQPLQQPQLPYLQLPETGIPPSRGETVAFAHSSTDHQVHRSLSEGSTVLVTLSEAGPQQPRYGVIRWVGDIAGVMGTIAGIEMVGFVCTILHEWIKRAVDTRTELNTLLN